jgi:hypothetical protein
VTEDIAAEREQACVDLDEVSPFIADFIADQVPSRAR